MMALVDDHMPVFREEHFRKPGAGESRKRGSHICEGANRHNAERLSGRATNKIVIFEGSAPHIGQIFPVKITRASGSTLYGDPAILE